jgi:hypothetical protein
MATRIDDLFEELKAYTDDTVKQASALEGIDTMPGSENDKPIPSGAENPDPKVKDETIDRPAKDTLDGAKKDGDIYNDTYVAALADLNTYLRAINEVDADNKAAYDAEKANEDTQAAFEKKLADAVAAMPSVYDKYVAQVGAVENPAEGTLRANYAAARSLSP